MTITTTYGVDDSMMATISATLEDAAKEFAQAQLDQGVDPDTIEQRARQIAEGAAASIKTPHGVRESLSAIDGALEEAARVFAHAFLAQGGQPESVEHITAQITDDGVIPFTEAV